MDIWGKSIPGRGRGKCKGPGAEGQICFQNNKEESVAEAERFIGRD